MSSCFSSLYEIKLLHKICHNTYELNSITVDTSECVNFKEQFSFKSKYDINTYPSLKKQKNNYHIH